MEFMKTKTNNLDSSFLYKMFSEYLNTKNIDINVLKSKIKCSKVKLDNIKINKEVFKKNNNTFNHLPSEEDLKILLAEIFEHKFNNTIASFKDDSFTSSLELDINYLKKINYGNNNNEKIILLDATGDKELLKYYGFNVVEEVKYNIKSDNLIIKQDFSHTYKTSSIKENGKIKQKYIDLFSELCNKMPNDTLFFTTKELEEDLKDYIKCDIAHYYKDDKATNKFKDKTRIIITPPKVNIDIDIKTGRILNNKLNNFEYEFIPIGTGYIKDGKELFNYELRFKEDLLNRIYYQQQQALMKQAIARIRRDFVNVKEIIILGNISLKEWGIIPSEIINFLEVEKNKPTENLKEKISNYLEKNMYILNQDFNSELLRNVQINDNKQASNIDINNVTSGFLGVNSTQSLTTTVFVLNPYINNNLGYQHKHCNINDLQPILSDLEKIAKNQIIKELSLVKSYLDIEGNRIYFYFNPSNFSKKEVLEKIKIEGLDNMKKETILNIDNKILEEQLLNKEISKHIYLSEVKRYIRNKYCISNSNFISIHTKCYAPNEMDNYDFYLSKYNDLTDLQVKDILDKVFVLFSLNREKINNYIRKFDSYIDLDNPIQSDYYKNKITYNILNKVEIKFNNYRKHWIENKEYITNKKLLQADNWINEPNINESEKIYRELLFSKLVFEQNNINKSIDRKILPKSINNFINDYKHYLLELENEILEFNKFESIKEKHIPINIIDKSFIQNKFLIDFKFNLMVVLSNLDHDFNNLNRVYSNIDFYSYFTTFLKYHNGNLQEKNRAYEGLFLYLYTFYRLNNKELEQISFNSQSKFLKFCCENFNKTIA